jgi:hypothetical protein
VGLLRTYLMHQKMMVVSARWFLVESVEFCKAGRGGLQWLNLTGSGRRQGIMSLEAQVQTAKLKLLASIEPQMLSFDVYGTLINTPPSNLQTFRSILLEASETNLDPISLYSLFSTISLLQRDLPPLPFTGLSPFWDFLGARGVD